jgi:hypothetical protein
VYEGLKLLVYGGLKLLVYGGLKLLVYEGLKLSSLRLLVAEQPAAVQLLLFSKLNLSMHIRLTKPEQQRWQQRLWVPMFSPLPRLLRRRRHAPPAAAAAAVCPEPRLPSRLQHSIRQHTSAYVSMRQHTSACVSIRERCLPCATPTFAPAESVV